MLLSMLFCCVFYGFRRCGTAPPLGINLARLGLEFCWGSAVSQACLTDAFIGHVHLSCTYKCPPVRHAPIIRTLLLCFYGFRRCCSAPPLGINLARLGLEFCWGSAVSQACLTDAFIGYVRLYAPICPSISAMMRLYPPTPRQARGGGAWEGQCQSMTFSFLEKANLYASMPKIEFETKDKTKDSIVTPGGLGILLKCCTAPPLRMHLPRLGLEFCWGSTVLQACFTDAFIGHVHLPCAYMSSSPPCAYYMHAFALCLRVSKMLYGTASGDQFGTPWARILLGFRCFASLPHGRAHRPCPPTCLYAQLSAMRVYIHAFVHAFAVFLRVSKMLYGTASGDEFAVSEACLTDAFIGHVHLPCTYVQLSAMRLIYARFCFVFTGFEDAVRHRLWKSIWHALGSNSAGVPLFRKHASRTHASRTRSSAMSTYLICPAIRHAPIYPCSCPCFCSVFTGFEDAVRHRPWG